MREVWIVVKRQKAVNSRVTPVKQMALSHTLHSCHSARERMWRHTWPFLLMRIKEAVFFYYGVLAIA